MKITPEQIQHIALLARLELKPDEITALTGQLDEILSYIATLNELDTNGVQPTTHTMAVKNAFRDDTLGPSLARELALANAPVQSEESFVVPRVIA